MGASAVLGFARSARAEQLVPIDATFDYTWDDALDAKPSAGRFYVNEKTFLEAQRTKNWLSPVDHRNGTSARAVSGRFSKRGRWARRTRPLLRR